VRIWDVSPGYLNRQSLLGEHRELHGLVSILVNGKRGYSRHPETLRWVNCLSGLARRHAQLVAEMRLRGYSHLSPLDRPPRGLRWPVTYVTAPVDQYALLAVKYRDRDPGRIPLPRNAQELWAHHKYSVMARDPALYRAIGRRVAAMRRGHDMATLAGELAGVLRLTPSRPRLANAVDHLWGYVSRDATPDERRRAAASLASLFHVTRVVAARTGQPYLATSTALSDLAVFVAPLQRSDS
jgi:hypothetical protein